MSYKHTEPSASSNCEVFTKRRQIKISKNPKSQVANNIYFTFVSMKGLPNLKVTPFFKNSPVMDEA